MEFDFEAKDKHGNTYIRQGGQWFSAPIFFMVEKIPWDFDKVPDEVKEKLRIEEEKRMSELMDESTSSAKYDANESVDKFNDMDEDDDEDEIKPKMMKKESSASTSAGNILARSKHPSKKHHHVNKATPPTSEKFNPRQSAAAITPMSGKKVKDASKPGHLADNKGKKEKLPYVLITDSQQLIRPIRAELKVTAPEMANQLLARMRIRKRINIFDEEEEEEASKLKPFEPTKTTKKRDLNYLDAHDQNRQKVHDVGVNLVVKLERFKHQRKILRNAKIGEEELIPASSVTHLRLKPEVCFKIEDLEQFAKARGLVVLNLDKFILSTDQRVPIYNSDGNCNFCLMHLIETNGRHSDDQECPYKFCNCTRCYVAGKFGNRLEEFFSLGKDEDAASNSAVGNNEEEEDGNKDDDELPTI